MTSDKLGILFLWATCPDWKKGKNLSHCFLKTSTWCCLCNTVCRFPLCIMEQPWRMEEVRGMFSICSCTISRWQTLRLNACLPTWVMCWLYLRRLGEAEKKKKPWLPDWRGFLGYGTLALFGFSWAAETPLNCLDPQIGRGTLDFLVKISHLISEYLWCLYGLDSEQTILNWV